MLGLCWPVFELCWPILGLCWPILGLCGPILGLLFWPILGLCGPNKGAMLGQLPRLLGLMLGHVDPSGATRSKTWEKPRNTVKSGKFPKSEPCRPGCGKEWKLQGSFWSPGECPRPQKALSHITFWTVQKWKFRQQAGQERGKSSCGRGWTLQGGYSSLGSLGWPSESGQGVAKSGSCREVFEGLVNVPGHRPYSLTPFSEQ